MNPNAGLTEDNRDDCAVESPDYGAAGSQGYDQTFHTGTSYRE